MTRMSIMQRCHPIPADQVTSLKIDALGERYKYMYIYIYIYMQDKVVVDKCCLPVTTPLIVVVALACVTT